MNKFIYSNNYKRYHSYDYYLKKKYDGKVTRIALNAGFFCPHITTDGGCIFCAVHNKKANLLSPEQIRTQFHEKKQSLAKKWKNTKYIAYFQAGSNTFASLADLKRVYGSVLPSPVGDGELNIPLVGIDIATRPDCITREIAEYLASLSKEAGIDISVELGLQTIHDDTACFINRGYSLEIFERAYKILAEYNIFVTLHIINSLPNETREMMLETARYIAKLNPLSLGVKIHQLYVADGTRLYDLYNTGEVKLLSKEEYIDIVVSQLEILPPKVVIMRLTGDPELTPNETAIPEWAAKKFAVINDIDKRMVAKGTYQGKLSGHEYINYTDTRAESAHLRPKETDYRNRASLTNMLSMTKRLLDISIRENGVYADFTMGKGGDVLYIKKSCPSAKIYAFDIQSEAVQITKKRLEDEKCFDENVILINDSHANLRNYISEELDGAIFNLGYLPGSDKSVTTQTDSTFACLTAALEILKPGGVIVVSVYQGHEEGAYEGDKILESAANLEKKEYDCLYHRLINIPEAPFIVAFQKKHVKQK